MTVSLTEVLVVSNYYPPMELGGAKRIIKFVKYLPDFNYQPVILTQSTYGSLIEDGENRIFRAKDLLGNLKLIYRQRKYNSLKTIASDIFTQNFQFLGKLTESVQSFLAPDSEITWYFPACRLGRKILSTRPIKILYSTSPSETNHLVALKLKEKTGLPWVVDFRDGWMFEPLQKARISSPVRKYVDSKLERKVIKNADRIITVNEIIAQDIVSRYPDSAGKISIIYNGYDRDDFSNLSILKSPKSGKFRLVHTGKLSLSRPGGEIAFESFLKALKNMRENRSSIINDLEVIMVGSLTSQEIGNIESYGLKDCFCLTGSVSYEKSLEYQINADALLLITSATSIGVSTSKLFEYLATGRPILAITNCSSAAAKLVVEMEAGVVTEPDNILDIQYQLENLYKTTKSEQSGTKTSLKVANFERRHLTYHLAEIFNQFQ